MNSGPVVLALLCAAMAIGGVLLFISAFGRMRLRRAIEDTPTSKIRSVPMGKVELKGLAQPFGKPAVGPFSGIECVWHRWTVEEERSTVDAKGNTQKTWERVASGSSDGLFQLDDTTGVILVAPGGAEVDAPQVYAYTQGGIFNAGVAPGGPLFADYRGGAFSGRRRFREWRLEIQHPLYILGVVRPGRGDERIMIGQGRLDEPFLISARSEGELLDGMFWGTLGRLVFGAGLTLCGLALAAHGFLGW